MNTPEQNEGRGHQRSAKPSQMQPALPLAVRAVEAVGQDVVLATDEAFRLLTADKAAMKSLLPQIVRAWCSHQVRAYLSDLREAALRRSDPLQSPADQGGARLRAAIHVFLMDFPLPGTGKRLGDATGEEAAVAAQYYRGIAADASLKSRWLQAVADRAGCALVATALTEEQLQQLREQADAQ